MQPTRRCRPWQLQAWLVDLSARYYHSRRCSSQPGASGSVVEMSGAVRRPADCIRSWPISCRMSCITCGQAGWPAPPWEVQKCGRAACQGPGTWVPCPMSHALVRSSTCVPQGWGWNPVVCQRVCARQPLLLGVGKRWGLQERCCARPLSAAVAVPPGRQLLAQPAIAPGRARQLVWLVSRCGASAGC